MSNICPYNSPNEVAQSTGCVTNRGVRTIFHPLDWTTSMVQARSPGEKDLGVGMRGVMFGIPALIFGIAGLALLIISVGREAVPTVFLW